MLARMYTLLLGGGVSKPKIETEINANRFAVISTYIRCQQQKQTNKQLHPLAMRT